MTEEMIFHAVLERADPAERNAYLDQACGGNTDLRRRLEDLLRAHEDAGADNFLEPFAPAPELVRSDSPDAGPTAAQAGPGPIAEGPGSQIGPYKLLQRLGEGGMGVVYMAEQASPIRRRVALKIIKPGMDTEQVVARFEVERQALAMMDHPNIAKVLDAGATASGRPYFVMELVKGVSITEYCDGVQLTPLERLELFLPVCQAIQHAHQKGVIHRDVKPSNVLVTIQDGKPVPKVIDFGVAKATQQRLTERSVFTQFGAVIGTLEYMSPEQAELSPLDVDTRTDVYALGVLLYELLTGTTPLEREQLRQTGYAEILRRIREEEPPRPSVRLSDSREALPSIAALRKTEPARLTKLVRGELDRIVMKALEKDRRRRYETANGFARDIQRHLDGDPVEAWPPSAAYKLKKFARKHRVALATIGAFTLLLVAATASSTALALWANRERIRAEESEQTAIDAVKRFADVVRETPELKTDPALAPLRAKLLKEPQAFFKQLRDRLQANKARTPESLARLASASHDLGHLTWEIADRQDAVRSFEEALAIFEQLARDNPTITKFQRELAGSLNNIGSMQRQTGRTMEALASYERTRAVIERLVREYPKVSEFQRDLAVNHHNIANLKREMGRTAEALASSENARAIRERLAHDNPTVTQYRIDLAHSHNSLGLIQSQTGRMAEALDSYKQSRAIREQLAIENPTVPQFLCDLADAHNNIGNLYRQTGHAAESLAALEESRTILERLVVENPAVTQFKSDLARSYDGIGLLLSEMGRTADALASYDKSRTITAQLAHAHPKIPQFQAGLARINNSIGLVQRAMGRAEDALASYEEARLIQDRLAREDPAALGVQNQMARILNNIGNVQRDAGRVTEALAAFEQARAIQERLAREHPEMPENASALGGTLNNMAIIDLNRRQFEKAHTKLSEAIQWQRKALAANPRHPSYRQFLKNHLTHLIRANQGLGRADEAASAQRELDELRNSEPQLVALDARLVAVLNGKETPTNEAERLRLAYRAYEKTLHAGSARLFGETLANAPEIADDRQAQHRYNAACAAALAGSGQGKDDPAPDETAKTKLRRQAREWLQAELAAWTRILDSGTPEKKAEIAPTLQHWQSDAELAGIRDEKALAKLPETERNDHRALWSAVNDLLRKATGLSTPAH